MEILDTDVIAAKQLIEEVDCSWWRKEYYTNVIAKAHAAGRESVLSATPNEISRHIAAWSCFNGPVTARRLFASLTVHSQPIPDWLLNEPCLDDINALVSIDNRILLLHKSLYHNQDHSSTQVDEHCSCGSDDASSDQPLPPSCKAIFHTR